MQLPDFLPGRLTSGFVGFILPLPAATASILRIATITPAGLLFLYHNLTLPIPRTATIAEQRRLQRLGTGMPLHACGLPAPPVLYGLPYLLLPPLTCLRDFCVRTSAHLCGFSNILLPYHVAAISHAVFSAVLHRSAPAGWEDYLGYCTILNAG